MARKPKVMIRGRMAKMSGDRSVWLGKRDGDGVYCMTFKTGDLEARMALSPEAMALLVQLYNESLEGWAPVAPAMVRWALQLQPSGDATWLRAGEEITHDEALRGAS